MPPPLRVPVPVTVPPPASDRSIHLPTPTLRPRDDGKSNPKQVEITVFVLGAIAGTIILAFLIRHFYRRFADSKHAYKPALHDEDTSSTRQINRRNQYNLEDALVDAQARRVSNNGARGQTLAGDAGVDRNTSVRSVMTLPVYRPKATENERVLGREGERDGIDVVVEMRTAEDEEALRDEEMEALYQIRAARRRQLADREERRRLRREARETNNVVALRELRSAARDLSAQNVSEIADLRSEHDRIRGARQRAVSSVSYADVGIARADGTRVRANSTESTERVGLLSDAASISAIDNNSILLRHRRDRSASTATLSIDTSRSDHRPESPSSLSIPATAGSYGFTPSPLGRERTNSGATTPRIASPSATTITTPRAGSSPEIIDAEDADLGDASMPPPGYDEVSLDDLTPLHSRRNSDVSAAARPLSPYPDPPPEYPGPGPSPTGGGLERRRSRLSAHLDGLAAAEQAQVGGGQGQGRDEGGPPRLPSLRLAAVPQIVIEPSTARP